MDEREPSAELREIRVTGREAVALGTELLQRTRLAEPSGGVWEAADVQWWWRKPRRSDEIEQVFWTDRDGPVAAVLLTDFGHSWQCDPIVLPGLSSRLLPDVWTRANELIDSVRPGAVEVPVRDDDEDLVGLVRRVGFTPAEPSAIAWMDADDRPPVATLPEGFVLVDRTAALGKPHPFIQRNGDGVESRLRQCSLYDPALDLAVETVDGQVAGISLYWFDPVTAVGLLEPMRVEGAYQRRGLARAMLTAGLDRLAGLGARRIKVSYSTDVAGALYESVGFSATATATWYATAPEAGFLSHRGSGKSRQPGRVVRLWMRE